MVESRTQEQWSNFCNCPFNEEDGYTCYVEELAKIGLTYKIRMLAKNSDGLSALQVLSNGASREHYEALQNSSRLFARLGVMPLFGGTQHIGLPVIIVWIFESLQSVLESLL